MAFKSPASTASVPDSPDKIFRDLTRRKYPDVLPHQAEIMQSYARDAINLPDVALQLPTGSGKTLVGLLIAEWRRLKFNEKVVYLCPTKQLVHQVATQAHDKYGLSVATFVGSKRDYLPAAKADYSNGDKVAITTYSGLFNTSPYFTNPDLILLDDAHVSENYIASYWTLRIESAKSPVLHKAICNLLTPHLAPVDLSRLRGDWEDSLTKVWVDKLPTPILQLIKNEIIAILDVHTQDTDLYFPWTVLRGNLDACHLYISSQEILIRPLLPPTHTHLPFENARQRIYMSATLGAGGDLERLTGRKNIQRLAAPSGWDTQGVGRRFFIFPEMSLNESEVDELRVKLINSTERSVILAPSDALANKISSQISTETGLSIYRAEDIESSKETFVHDKAVAVIANRYDGVDFAGDECRLLFIEGLPKATNSQEKFLMSKMGANIIYNERIQTRVVQAIGRCTRSLEDFSAVVLSGEELPDYLSDIRRRKYFHPELQAEIEFGVTQSKDTDVDNIVENFQTFLANSTDWESANRTIVEARKRLVQESLPAISELQDVVKYETEYQTALWRHDYEKALECAESVLGGLKSADLRGYRALWNYLAGSAAYIGAKSGVSSLDAKARQHFSHAYKCAPDIRWLAEFARKELPELQLEAENEQALKQQVERISAELTKLGTTHDRDFAKLEKKILTNLSVPARFEEAQVELGKLIGFISGKREEEGSPDPWWISGNDCIVFEDYVNTTSEGTLDVTKARQASSHPDWMKANVPESNCCNFIATLVTPAKNIRVAATPHVDKVKYWEYSEFITWANIAIQTIRELRTTFFETGDLVWQAEAESKIKDRGLSFKALIRMLNEHPVKECMVAVGEPLL